MANYRKTSQVMDKKKLLQTYRGLNGATFQVYDVTESFTIYEKRGKQ